MVDLSGCVDLHTHTTASDGTLTPRQLAALAKEIGLAAVAITDHDTVSGLEEGMAAGKELGVRVIPGVELSTQLEGREIHIVGLFVDPSEPELLAQLEQRRRERVLRNEKLLEKLKGLGIVIPPEEVRPDGGLFTRTHVAEAMARHGYAKDAVDALERYLTPGKPAWVEKSGPPPARCVQVIHKAGGRAFLAHLDRIHRQDEAHAVKLAREALAAGMDGLEARYTTYTPRWEAIADGLAAELGLLRSGGSDFHGARKRNQLGTGFGELRVPRAWLEEWAPPPE